VRSAPERVRGAARARARRAAATVLLAGLGATSTGVAGASPDTALRECRIAGIEHAVECGSVRRPLDPARPEGAAIDVQFVVVPAMARRKLPDPVFFLAGGPGQSAIAVAPLVLPLLERLRNRRDLVFVDQRGTGRSAPLACPDAREPFSALADTERQIERIGACRRALEASTRNDGKELMRHATTTEAMQDLDAVRRALGAERVDLIGGSYGTRAALEYQRQFPDAVRRMVLDGVAPPDMALVASLSADSQAALDALLDACRREPACARQHPALRARWQALLAGLPREVVVADPLSGEPTSVRLTRDAVLGAVRGPLYAPALAAALPAAIDAAAAGRFDGLVGLASLLASRRETDLALGMHFSVVCAEDLPRLRLATDRPGADFGDDFARFYARVCADWPRGDVPAAFYRLGRSATAVLLLSGGADPATPPRHAARVAAALGPLARHVVVPEAGHGVMPIGCMRDVVFRFIDAPDDGAALAVDAGCAAGVPRPPAYEPPSAAASAP
jgi:pimeloyl-ACP methyl ester carboxylesterase